MHTRTLVTGADGRVGRVLRERLVGFPLTFTSHTTLDVTDAHALERAMMGHEQVVHLATPIRANVGTRDDFRASVDWVRRVLETARDAGLRRVILPSSISALAPEQLHGAGRVTIEESRPAETEYGRTRIEVEGIGREAGAAGLEVVCIRLGTVRHPDHPVPHSGLRNHWLSHEDCASVFAACLSAPVEPGRFSLFYAVSDLPQRILDTSNPFGWAPTTRHVGSKRRVLASLHRLNTGVRGALQLRTRWKRLMGSRKD